MAKTMPVTPPTSGTLVALKSLTPMKTEQVKANSRLLAAVDELTVESPEDLLTADALLGQVQVARKGWAHIWEKFYDATVKPLRSALEGAYDVNREIDKPLETAEKRVKGLMSAYRDQERRRLQAAEEERQREAERLQAAIDAQLAKAEAAKTPAAQKLALNTANRMVEAQAAVITDVQTAVQAVHSTTRYTPTPVISDMAEFAVGVLAGGVELDEPMQAALALWLKREYKKDPEGVASWPGITIEQKPTIVGR